MKPRSNPLLKNLPLAMVSTVTAVLTTLASATTYSWNEPVANGSLSDTSVNSWSTAGNWVGGSVPASATTTVLDFGDPGGSMTVNASTMTLNKLVSNSSSQLRINSGLRTLTFGGTDAGIDVQSGTTRLEVALTGSTTFNKSGTGTLFLNLQGLSNTNWTGNININEGYVQPGNNNALGASGKTVTVASGATLNWNGQELGSMNIVNPVESSGQSAKVFNFSIAGDGYASVGALINTGSAINGTNSGINNLTLTADASIGGTGDLGIGWNSANTYVYGNDNTLTKHGTSTVSIQSRANNVNWDISAGKLQLWVDNAQTSLGSGQVDIRNGGTLELREDYGNSVGDGNADLIMEGGSTFYNPSASFDQQFNNTATLTGGEGDSGLATFTVATNASVTLSAGATGSGGIRKKGSGDLMVYSTGDYTGDTVIESGTLYAGVNLSGSSHISLTGSTAVFANDIHEGIPGEYLLGASQTLSGIGTFQDLQGGIGIAGTVSPGNSPGVLTLDGDTTFYGGSDIVWELWDNTLTGRGTNFDGIDVISGDLTFNGLTSLNLDFSGGSVNWADVFWTDFFGENRSTSKWLLFDYSGTGTVSGVDNLSVASANWQDSNGLYFDDYFSGEGFTISQVGSDIYLSAVPEPASMLGMAGLLGGGILLRRRQIRG